MLRATIVKERYKDQYHVRIGKEPQKGGDVEVIEILVQREGESKEELAARAHEFALKELGVSV